MRKLLLALAATATSASAIPPVPPPPPPAPPPPPPAPPPSLLIVISIDQLSSDLFEEYRPHLTGGLARLASGTVFRNGYQGHAATETCPGHSTILTGSRPARTGIIANSWVDQSLGRTDKTVYCAEDVKAPGSSSRNYTVSPIHLKVPTLGELMKPAWRESRTVAIAGKDRSAVMMSGQRPDQRWYWDGKAFVTDLAGRAVPRTITRGNAALGAALSQAREPLELPVYCQNKAREIAVEGGSQPVGTGRFARAGGDASAFRVSPDFDAAVLALSAAMIGELGLGQRRAPDLMTVGLAATDYVGHRYGNKGAEMCLQMFALDRELGSFFSQLDRQGLDYAVALTADHGGQDIPERLRLLGVQQAKRVDPSLSATAVGKTIGQKLKLAGPVLIGHHGGDVYVDRALRPADKRRVIAEALASYRAHPDVEAAFSAEELRQVAPPTATPDRWTLIERAKASFDPDRSGDVVVLLRNHVTPIVDTKSYVATHGSPWDYDRRVPILFWRKGMGRAEREQPVETADIMPTLAAMIGLPLGERTIDGKCLLGIPGVACPPR
jgi:predicted AlkP superfamily pyrophosphatase or phosphodiesterase